MKIYIAHNFSAREELWKMVVPKLYHLGHSVTARWLNDSSNDLSHDWASKDLQDVDDADALLIYVDQTGNSPGRGKWVELGYALAKGKKIYAFGFDLNCIFLHLTGIKQICTLEEIV